MKTRLLIFAILFITGTTLLFQSAADAQFRRIAGTWKIIGGLNDGKTFTIKENGYISKISMKVTVNGQCVGGVGDHDYETIYLTFESVKIDSSSFKFEKEVDWDGSIPPNIINKEGGTIKGTVNSSKLEIVGTCSGWYQFITIDNPFGPDENCSGQGTDAWRAIQTVPTYYPDIAVTPPSHDYGNVNVGEHKDNTFVVKNEGNDPLSVSSTALVGSDASEFRIQSGGGSFDLNPGETQNIVVRFAPQSAGHKNATLRIASNDPNENPYDVPLIGGCIGPDISVTPTPYDYGNVKVGEHKDNTFVVKNEGVAALLSVSSTTLVGSNASEFRIQSGGGSFDLNPEETRNVVVRFSPQSFGNNNAILRFVSNDPNENPYDVTLTGKSGPDISVTPPSYDYGDVKGGEHKDNTFVVKNEGVAALLSVSSTTLVGSNASEFSIQSGGGSFDLDPGETHNVVVRFAPQSVGNKNATLRIASNDPDENPYDVPLSGSSSPDIAVTPPSHDYGNIKVGEHLDNTFVVKNEGVMQLSTSSTTLVGSNASEFSIQSGGGSFDLDPGETHNVVVRFAPQSVGNKNATLRIASNDPDENPYDVPLSGSSYPDISVTPTSYDYGNVKVGEHLDNTFVVKNEGVAPLSVSSTNLVGDDASEFSIQSGGGSFDLNPGETQNVVVRFAPQFAEEKNATLRIASNDPDNNPFDVTLNGSGTTNLKWKFKTLGTYSTHSSSPAIGSYGTIYVGSYSKYLYALNPDGTEKWKFETGGSVQRSSPAIGSDGTIYVGSYDRRLYAVNPDGTLKWKFQTNYHVCSSPAIGSDGTIYVGSSDDYLYAINPDGTEKWKFKTGDEVASSPAIDSDGTIYVGSDDNYLYAINPDGTLKWEFKTGDEVASSPAVDSDGTIYVGSDDNYLYAINPNGTLKWEFQTGGNASSSPAIDSDGTIYVGSNDNYIYAINPDGTQKWKFKTGRHVYSSPAIGSDGAIYIGSSDDYLYAINPDGTQKWKFKTGDYVCSFPAIGSDGTVYAISKDNYLYALGSHSMGLVDSAWPKFHHDNQNTGRAPIGNYPVIVVTPPSYDYDNVTVGEYKDNTFVVKNIGGELLSVSDTKLVGANTSEFSIQNGGGNFDLNLGETRNVVVRFEPQSEGSKNTILRFVSNDPDDNPKDVPLNGGGLNWKFKTGDDVASSPAIGSDGTIYVGSSDYCLYAINPDGTQKWKFKTTWNVKSSPAIGSDGTIYVGSSDYCLYAINPDGTEKWKFRTGSYVMSSPAVGSDETIYVGSGDDHLYAVNPDGTEKWKFKIGGDVRSSPAIGSDGTIYVGSYRYLYALNPDGTQKWKFSTGGNSSPAVGSDGTIYVGGSRALYAINPDGTLKWKFQTGGRVDSSPAIGSDGTIYVGSNDDRLYALNPDGTEKWKFKTGYNVSSSPAIGSDGAIYVGSDDNYLYVLNPDGTQKWRFETGGRVDSPLAIGSDGTIYVGSWDNYLYALNSYSMGLADSHWPKFHHDNQNTGRVPGEILPIYGDVTGDGRVTALDAAVVLQACVGLVTLTPEQEIRANVSGGGGVTAYDAALIMQYVVGLSTKFPVEGGLVAPALTGRVYTISVGKICTKANERIVVPISVDDASGILSGKFSLTYDAAYLNPIDVRVRNRVLPNAPRLHQRLLRHSVPRNDITAPPAPRSHRENSVSKYNVRDGVLEISFANAEELKAEMGQDGSRPLLFVEFETRKTSTSTIPLTLSEAYLNEGLNIRKVNGWVKFTPETTALLPNFPNPFNPDTWIPYQLKESANVVIRIYNVSGQLVRILDTGYRQPGFYIDKMDAAYWDGRNEPGERVASGVYFYQLQSGKFSATRKMLIIK